MGEMLTSVWLGWELGAVTAGNDRFDTVADSIGLSVVLSGGVTVTWAARGQRRTRAFTEGMSDFRPADGDHHTYTNVWRPGATAFCLTIPQQQFDLAASEEAMQGRTTEFQHLFGFHDPVVADCMRALAAASVEGFETLDVEWLGRRLLVRLLELQGMQAASWEKATANLPKRLVSRVAEYVDARLGTPIPLSDLAAVAGLSPGHFARSFRSTTGITPGHFVRARRVAAAFDLLAASPLPLHEIAHVTGFCSQSHMTRSFVRVTGLTPGYVRRRRISPRILGRNGSAGH